ncbi:GNAT family N-acetyltransferase [Pedobacter cryoconitis]|uniref:Ribosomal protein S18 acetylase RimI-like enzyme n=1 Tax=Pedobacter cryoconitis TaxID=188932 RepID=A0A7X0J354_9SPHI|nr:GNAT family N-acetyltransferase [Pedobacter cryoconitis]MBB6498761.1 ribosomal protein S18 acetylase RimI-like enzyme [Pedobacter cryoconitis]
MMRKATREDKSLIVDMLSKCFDDNQSVNYIVKQDHKRKQRIISLMHYSFEICHLFGDVFISDDKKACALILYPEQKKITLKAAVLDLMLLLNCIGINNAGKAMSREGKIKGQYPDEPIYYLWFLGVDLDEQGKGLGSNLLNELINDSEKKQRSIYLETSTLRNIPFYKKFNFSIFQELDFGYKLYMLKRPKNQ